MSRTLVALLLVLLGSASMALPVPGARQPVDPCACTFSIAAYDPEHEEWGVGVASKYLAVGAVVPWARSGAGAVATQSWVNTTYGTRGLELLAEGKPAEEVLKTLTALDDGRELRQIGIIDSKGNTAHFTGSKCFAWAGAKSG